MELRGWSGVCRGSDQWHGPLTGRMPVAGRVGPTGSRQDKQGIVVAVARNGLELQNVPMVSPLVQGTLTRARPEGHIPGVSVFSGQHTRFIRRGISTSLVRASCDPQAQAHPPAVNPGLRPVQSHGFIPIPIRCRHGARPRLGSVPTPSAERITATTERSYLPRPIPRA